MESVSPEERVEAIVTSPAGCALLLFAEQGNLTPADLAKPEIGLFAISQAIGEISPWKGDHDWIVAKVLEHGPRLRDLAMEIVRHFDIAWWWAPIDRKNQLWLPQTDNYVWPEEDWDQRPTTPPNRWESYAHSPQPWISTSELRGNLSSELASVLSNSGDWALKYPIKPRQVTIRPAARVLEINTAQNWHDLVRGYPANGDQNKESEMKDVPWGQTDGMMVPDWSLVVRDWDGIHLTPWALLTASQVRVSSGIGWTEPWAWEGAHTLWLTWMFESVEELPPINEGMIESPNLWSEVLLADQASFGLRVNPPQQYNDRWPGKPGIDCDVFGDTEDGTVYRYTMTNSEGISVSILNYGGIIQSLVVPDAHGARDNVVLGFDKVSDYVEATPRPYFGATIGRFANRIANGRFELDGKVYTLAQNNGLNALHGGEKGFGRHLWTASIELEDHDSPELRLTRTSPDGEEGYPGTVDVFVAYRLWGNGLHISYGATSDVLTVINLTNHAYLTWRERGRERFSITGCNCSRPTTRRSTMR